MRRATLVVATMCLLRSIKSSIYGRGFAITVALLVVASVAKAAPIMIFNTGTMFNGVVAPGGTVGDPHYTLVSAAGGSTTILVRSAGAFPIPPWVGNDALSAWIGPNNDNSLDAVPGNYDYRTTFDLTGLDPSTASLTGSWAMDNSGVSILLNGVATGITRPDPTISGDPFMSFANFSITSGFVAGVNTLDFIINNDKVNAGTAPNPTGLRVEISGTAESVPDPAPVPEPASLVLFGAGFAGVYLLRRSRGAFGILLSQSVLSIQLGNG
jgi:hypothetical protein